MTIEERVGALEVLIGQLLDALRLKVCDQGIEPSGATAGPGELLEADHKRFVQRIRGGDA